MRTIHAVVVGGAVCASLAAVRLTASQAGQGAPAPNCVSIGTPSPTLGFTYDHVEPAARTQYTDYWESVTPTGSRVRVVKPGQTLTMVSVYEVVSDVSLIRRMTKASGGRVIESTQFSPGLVGDPAFRACAGGSWPVPSVTASFDGSVRSSARTPAGTLTILNINERITTPAGTFDTVRYVRTSQSRDEYWKSTQHGVIVKHVATVAGNLVTETLVSIR